jgi:cytochrome c oxidase subunit 3
MSADALPIADPRGPGAEDAPLPPEVARLGMWVFLASEVLFFGGLFMAYLYGRTHFPQGFAEAARHTHVVIGTVNTALLLTSSAVIAAAVACSQFEPKRHWAGRLLWVTALLGLAFLALKGVEYHKEWDEHLFPGRGFALSATPGATLFFWLYFVMTGLHAVHLVVGLALVATFAWGASHAKAWAAARAIDVVALYWHFVDIVWIFLYPLIYLVLRHS